MGKVCLTGGHADLVGELSSLQSQISNLGVVYSVAWKASSSSSVNTALTNSMTLPAGTYVIVVTMPNCSGSIVSSIRVGDIDHIVIGNSGMSLTYIAVLASEATVQYVSQQSAKVVFSNIGRGQLRALRIK